MCIYKKINDLRSQFHKTKLKKNGKGYGYNFFELADFLPTALKLCSEIGVFTQVSFSDDFAKMEVIDIANPDSRYEILSPMSEATLKNCHPVQNLGAVQTYIRRYLWMALLEVVEHDAIDGEKPEEEEKKLPEKKITPPKKTEPKPEPEPEPKPEPEKKAEEPKQDNAGNYNIHFMKQIQKTGNMKGALDMIKKIYGKDAADMTVAEKKKVLATMMQDLPKAGITID